MTKGSSSKKKPKSSLEGPVVEQENPSFKPKKMGSEIDDIFAGKKRKRLEKENKDNPEKPVRVSGKPHEYGRIVKNGKSKASKENELSNPTSRARKKTAEGLTVYTEEELGIGKSEAGGELIFILLHAVVFLGVSEVIAEVFHYDACSRSVVKPFQFQNLICFFLCNSAEMVLKLSKLVISFD
ncbi:hypothetical protein BUALT_Bualt11G0052600 [Buddleja alternifolia]|uniref:Uncharacterized protein n=1 Tax=Buddleja alternifolia TaxID=168488 RepID=A0AAV6WRQ7_9LAMI|nr:hypothetical protein BUALT_Bualt11G0052600 [Buddleja alternifolia]